MKKIKNGIYFNVSYQIIPSIKYVRQQLNINISTSIFRLINSLANYLILPLTH